MSRRGSIRREFNGTWTIVLDVPGDPPRRHQHRQRGFPTRRAAQAALTEALGEMQVGSFVRPDRSTLRAYLESWMASLPDTGRRPATVSSYRHTLRLHVVDHIGHLHLQELSPLDLDRLYAQLRMSGRRSPGGGGLSLRTVRYVHTVISVALADAVAKGLLGRNPASAASPPSASSARAPEMDWWHPDDTATFLAATAGSEFADLFHVAAMTGMRRGELLGLRWSDIDLARGRLTVLRQLTSTDYQVRIGEPKTARGRRTVDLDPTTVAVLEQLKSRATAEYVFTTAEGRSPHPEQITRAFAAAVRDTGLPRIRMHDLRHSHAAHLIAVGVDPLTISRRLGHASVAFTLDRYGHLFAQSGAEAAAKVAELVASTATHAPARPDFTVTGSLGIPNATGSEDPVRLGAGASPPDLHESLLPSAVTVPPYGLQT